MATIADSEIEAMRRAAQLPGISKATLQTICAVNGLPRSGVKADLQKRILSLIDESVKEDDLSQLMEIRQSIYAHAPLQRHNAPSLTPAPVFGNTATTMASNSYLNGAIANGHRHTISQSFQYRSSPFYEIVSRIGEVRTCEVMSQHRHSINIPVKLQDYPSLQQCVTDPTKRVMVFCAAGNTGVQEISFPHQSEIKVNGGEVKANLRGLKNKPGSTRPVDITSLLRLKPPGYPNNVEFTFALTTKRFYIGLYICDILSPTQLVERVKSGAKIPKLSVVREIATKASDPDVIATSQILSLKCPLSYMRLKDPCRGVKCNHIQCFDGTSYLQLQEQGPQWVCPICNKPAPFEQLAVDEYVQDILVNTSSSTEQVTIEPDGVWSAQTDKPEEWERATPKKSSFVNVDDDLVISESSFVGSRGLPTPNRSLSGYNTPVKRPRESSTGSRSATSNKRPAPEVIDLTLSDDEPDERPPKRQNTALSNPWNGGPF